MKAEVKLRVATVDDVTRQKDDQRVLLVGKDFWAVGAKGDLQYYRINPRNPEVVRMLKQGIPRGLIMVVDVEGEEERLVKEIKK